ncbi:MAG: hypothetical protein A3J46_00260 [Candidatus Yanofskybacteria bacterium RIFCSPHIGHO2_02_FULL_41_11]|uniref:Uncharacterized protein n=1 Tax=Candidatus Yanofskybacteria bacterium RIFCSPHIGHO2_02_FULL_41_11 TaxID=1802675 RepID=A0A1F8F9W7_9BACT|nr:MAG: hypothetical protein UW86_C0007G0017 [Microgenomates group bacterium GW2011_GWA1_Microgenomates_45_10]OGN09039.1 MAG: hypothetical protein A3J46_00260 [Candidatus Yanofskybacteria bacterium RIFCSPHIGHO2_02_FULL_41_11]
MARPKKTTKDLPKNWKGLISREMREGASKQEIKIMLGLSNDLFERLMKEDKEFSETMSYGVELSEAWWLKQGRLNLKNKQFNYGGWYMNMKNRFAWRDRQATDVTSGERPIAGVVIMPRKRTPEEDGVVLMPQKLTPEEADAGLK